MSAVIHGPGEGERHGAGAAEVVIKADGEATGGTFYLSEATISPEFAGPPLHRHRVLHDMFYVLEGTLTLHLAEDETRELGPGGFACVPPGVVHTFSNRSAAPVRFLNLNTPSGFEHYMRDLAEGAGTGTLTSEEIGRIASRHDFEAVRPPSAGRAAGS